MPVTTGSVLAERYTLGDRLGRGGMADVFRADDQVLHRTVAIKVLRETTDNETDRARFSTEARTLAGLTHEGLVLVLDAGITTEQPYLVMELVEGPTLSQRIGEGPLAEAEVAEIGGRLAEALAFAHRRSIVHRDIKPGNVLLGVDGQVKLADFGVARLIGDTVRHTQTGHAIGTAAYLAPEQVRGQELTTEVDVYCLGLVLIEALSGVRCFPGSPTESALARLSRPPEIPEHLTAAWRRLLTTMTAAEPEARPTAEQVAAELTGIGSPTSAASIDHGQENNEQTALLTNPVPTTPAVIPARQPTRRVLAAAVLVLGLIVAVLAFRGGGEDRSPTPEVPAGVPGDLQAPLQELHDAVGAR